MLYYLLLLAAGALQGARSEQQKIVKHARASFLKRCLSIISESPGKRNQSAKNAQKSRALLPVEPCFYLWESMVPAGGEVKSCRSGDFLQPCA